MPKLHIDKRAAAIAASAPEDDDLLSTPQLAAWLGVSEPWLEIGRHSGWGPPFERLGPRLIRYSRRKVRKWLEQRSHRCTGEYAKKRGRAKARPSASWGRDR